MSYWTLTSRLRAEGLVLERGIPRGAEHVLLQVRTADGSSQAGQWFADPERARRVLTATRAAAPQAPVRRPLPDVVLQPEGADRRLAGLSSRCQWPGARLVAHRPERRGVIEHRDAAGHRYSKVMRPERLTTDPAPQIPGVPTPEVIDIDQAAGVVTTLALPGHTLHEALRNFRRDPPRLTHQLQLLGATIARLHSSPVPATAPRHDGDAEIAVVERWQRLAAALAVSPLDGATAAAGVSRARRLLAQVEPVRALLHRDLHDKQVLLDGDGVGLLDLDLLSVGDPALDLANLAVHLELRARQGLLPLHTAGELVRALLAGYQPDARTVAALPGYLLTARLRLVSVYAFRPGSAAAALTLLTNPHLQELT